jgi:hypothetical protein
LKISCKLFFQQEDVYQLALVESNSKRVLEVLQLQLNKLIRVILLHSQLVDKEVAHHKFKRNQMVQEVLQVADFLNRDLLLVTCSSKQLCCHHLQQWLLIRPH